MARRKDKEEAIKLRKQGLSYSQIKQKLGVSKGTLSPWLANMPLSKERMRELQFNDAVIEKIRATKLRKKNERLSGVYEAVAKRVGKLSQKEIFLAGLFLYWAEGTKRQNCTVTLANTDPQMIKFHLKWLRSLGVRKEYIYVRLHLYSDMKIKEEMDFWSKVTKLPLSNFKPPYIKNSKFSQITYQTFGHGTCNIIVYNRDLYEYIIQGIKYISNV